MAVEVHYVATGLINIDSNGEPYFRNNSNKTIKECLRFTTEMRVIPDITIANSADYPNIKEYLEAEAADGFATVQIGNNFIVTQKVT